MWQVATYIPPNVDTNIFIQFIDDLFDVIEEWECDLVLVGDFNCPGFDNVLTNNNKIKVLRELTYLGNLKQYNIFYNHKNNMLDLVLSTFYVQVERPCDILTRVDQAHPPFQFSIPFNSVTKIIKEKVTTIYHNNNNTILKFTKFNKELLLHDLTYVDWSAMNLCHDIDAMVDLFYNLIISVFSQSLPTYNDNSKTKENFPPWFSKALIQDIKLKSTFWKKYKKHPLMFISTAFGKLERK